MDVSSALPQGSRACMPCFHACTVPMHHVHGMTHPPFGMHDGEAEVVHNPVVVVILMRMNLSSHRETFQTEVKIRANCTFDPGNVAYIFCAVVAVIEVSARCDDKLKIFASAKEKDERWKEFRTAWIRLKQTPQPMLPRSLSLPWVAYPACSAESYHQEVPMMTEADRYSPSRF